MRNLRDPRISLPDTVKPGDFPIGSLESRAAARSMLKACFDTAPDICFIVVASKAQSLNPGPIRWGTVPGLAEIFERGSDESDDDFITRLRSMRPKPEGPGPHVTFVRIYAETMKPEPPAMVPAESGSYG